MTKDCLGGVIAFCIFAMPAALFMLVLGLWQVSLLRGEKYEISDFVRIAF
jgi:hypothetical protein